AVPAAQRQNALCQLPAEGGLPRAGPPELREHARIPQPGPPGPHTAALFDGRADVEPPEVEAPLQMERDRVEERRQEQDDQYGDGTGARAVEDRPAPRSQIDPAARE